MNSGDVDAALALVSDDLKLQGSFEAMGRTGMRDIRLDDRH